MTKFVQVEQAVNLTVPELIFLRNIQFSCERRNLVQLIQIPVTNPRYNKKQKYYVPGLKVE